MESIFLNKNKIFVLGMGMAAALFLAINYNTIQLVKKSAYITPDEPTTQLVAQMMETQKEATITPPGKNRVILNSLQNLDKSKNIKKAHNIIDVGHISSPYGYRKKFGRFHYGIDIAAPRGTKIFAYNGGKVTFSGRRGAYGLMMEIDHGNGQKTRYAHCSALYYKQGATVKPGQYIADVGSTGRSTGPHLHFELLKNGKAVNPRGLFKHL